jgi:hypothetical protein
MKACETGGAALNGNCKKTCGLDHLSIDNRGDSNTVGLADGHRKTPYTGSLDWQRFTFDPRLNNKYP